MQNVTLGRKAESEWKAESGTLRRYDTLVNTDPLPFVPDGERPTVGSVIVIIFLFILVMYLKKLEE
jgi:hypothetical protein